LLPNLLSGTHTVAGDPRKGRRLPCCAHRPTFLHTHHRRGVCAPKLLVAAPLWPVALGQALRGPKRDHSRERGTAKRQPFVECGKWLIVKTKSSKTENQRSRQRLFSGPRNPLFPAHIVELARPLVWGEGRTRASRCLHLARRRQALRFALALRQPAILEGERPPQAAPGRNVRSLRLYLASYGLRGCGLPKARGQKIVLGPAFLLPVSIWPPQPTAG